MGTSSIVRLFLAQRMSIELEQQIGQFGEHSRRYIQRGYIQIKKCTLAATKEVSRRLRFYINTQHEQMLTGYYIPFVSCVTVDTYALHTM